MMGQQLAVPQIAGVTQVARMGAQVPFDFLPSPIIQPARTTFPRAFPQPVESTVFKAMNPTLDGRGMFAKPLANLIATMSLAHQQNSVQPMIVARLIGAADLLLEGNFHYLCICNLQSFHAPLLPEGRPHGKHIILHYLCRFV
jgi:hypothetical protein